MTVEVLEFLSFNFVEKSHLLDLEDYVRTCSYTESMESYFTNTDYSFFLDYDEDSESFTYRLVAEDFGVIGP